MDFDKDTIREMRGKLDMTQAQFAKEVGVGIATVVRWEGGDFRPSRHIHPNLERVAKKAGMIAGSRK